jgi:hypothetical protein
MRTAEAVLVTSLSLCVAACAVGPGEKKNTPGCENRGEALSLGMTKPTEGGLFTTSLLSASPLPPLQGPNLWTVEVATSSGDPVMDVLDPEDSTQEGDSHVIARIYMVEHMHRLDKLAIMSDPGVFEIPEFPITMNGFWEVTISVRDDHAPDGDEGDSAAFGFCIK